MAGIALISLQQFLNPTTFRPYGGAKAYFYEAGTLTALNTYRVAGLGSSNTHPNPVVADASGRFPAIFLDEEDSFYRVRVTQSNGSAIPLGDGPFDVDSIPIVGPSGEGGGSEVPVDANALLKTGDPLWVPKTGTRTGFVRMNGRTIGSATSGAVERANADCEILFTYAWDNFSDSMCPVTGGRGANAAADWAANKPIATLDMRNKGPFGLDDMGNSALSGFSGVTFAKGDSTTAGSQGGAARHTLTTSEMPAHTHGVTDPGHTHSTDFGASATQIGAGSFNAADVGNDPEGADEAETNITIDSEGGGAAHNNMPPFALGTWYWKLVIPGFIAANLVMGGLGHA